MQLNYQFQYNELLARALGKQTDDKTEKPKTGENMEQSLLKEYSSAIKLTQTKQKLEDKTKLN